MLQARVWLAAVVAGVFTLTACTTGGGSVPDAAGTGSPAEASAPTSGAPSAPPVDGSQTPAPSAPSTPTPTPTPTPSDPPREITGEDLLFGLPTNKQMSNVQGYRFVENDDWVEGDDAGPQWVRTAPLTKKQRKQLGLGALRKVKPSRCDVVASYGDWWGVPTTFSTRDYIKAAAYSFRANDYKFYKANKVDRWYTVALALPPGQAQVIVDDLIATREACRKYVLVTRDGDIERINNTSFVVKGKSSYRSGDAYVTRVRLSGDGPSGQTKLIVSEAIGNVLYVTDMKLNSSGRGILARASAVYNKLADNVAEAAGVTRQPIDLNSLTRIKGDPADYVPLTPPVASGSVA